MMEESLEIPGLELLFSSISQSLKDELDALVALVHWLIIKENAKCLQNTEGTKQSELLPKGWNNDSDDYTLKYVASNKQFTLKVLRMDQAALIHLVETDSDLVATLNVNISDVISSDFKIYDKMFVNLAQFYAKFKSEMSGVINRARSSGSTATGTTTTTTGTTEQPRPSQGQSTEDFLRSGPFRPSPMVDPFGYGVGDLDPLRAGQAGGGMTFDPFRGGGGVGRFPSGGRFPGQPGGGGGFMPPGSVPPGARFDPVGPNLGDDRGGPFRSGPRPDHMRPPDFDDQFM